jgi:ankyrin repeat protein
MPLVVSKLEEAIDVAAGTEKWIAGNAETYRSLSQEKWDFKDPKTNKDLLLRVAENGSSDAVKALLLAGAPISPGALAHAARRGEMEMVKALLDAGAGNDSRELNAALFAAASAGKLEAVQFLISASANPNYLDRESKDTILIAAASSGHPEVVSEILKYKVDVNARDKSGKTALMYVGEAYIVDEEDEDASEARKAAVAERLFAGGANPEIKDNEGQTALFFACYAPKLMKVLLAKGADPNASDNEGQTALMDCNHVVSLTLLLASGANPSLRDNDGHTALDLAIEAKDEEKIALLRGVEISK